MLLHTDRKRLMGNLWFKIWDVNSSLTSSLRLTSPFNICIVSTEKAVTFICDWNAVYIINALSPKAYTFVLISVKWVLTMHLSTAKHSEFVNIFSYHVSKQYLCIATTGTDKVCYAIFSSLAKGLKLNPQRRFRLKSHLKFLAVLSSTASWYHGPFVFDNENEFLIFGI